VTSRQPIPISRIRVDGGTQPRAALDFDAIEDYSVAMGAGAHFPPVTVYYDGADYWLADGFHRVKAAYAASHDTIESEVHQGTLEDAQWYSFSANRANGLRRTNSDKQRAVKSAITHPNGTALSNRQIAVHVGVDETTVRVWREKLTAGIPQSTQRTGRDGRTIDVSNIGKLSGSQHAPAPLTDAPPPVTTNAGPDREAPSSPAPVGTTRSQRIDRLARLTASFLETTKRLAHLVGWLGETSGDFEQAELMLSKAGDSIVAAIAEIERKALSADPPNACGLGIRENLS